MLPMHNAAYCVEEPRWVQNTSTAWRLIIMIAKAKCSSTKTSFAIGISKTARGVWQASAAFAISASRAEGGYGHETVNEGLEIGTTYPGCTHCGNKSIFLCLSCQSLNCQGSAISRGLLRKQVYVTCGNCRAVGQLLVETISKFDGYNDI
jgi:hypothetical protein